MKVTQSCPTLWNSPGQNRVGSLSLLHVIFPTQGLNPGIPHCRWILYQLSHKGSPRILEWVAYPFSRGYSQPRNQTRVSCFAGRVFTNWAIREVHMEGCKVEEWNILTILTHLLLFFISYIMYERDFCGGLDSLS